MVKIERTELPTHSLYLPYSDKQIEFRSWNMAEHKVLVMAFESKSPRDVQRAVLQILRNIILDGTDPSKLPAIESDYVFMQARAKSVGEGLPIHLKSIKDGTSKSHIIDITSIEIKKDPKREYKIPLTNPNGTPMKYFLMMKELSCGDRLEVLELKERKPEIIEELETALRCIDKVCDEKETSSARDQMKELRELLAAMSPKQYEPIDYFVSTSPQLNHRVDISKVFPEGEGELVLEGLDSFFD